MSLASFCHPARFPARRGRIVRGSVALADLFGEQIAADENLVFE